jgi:hypothetical protein
MQLSGTGMSEAIESIAVTRPKLLEGFLTGEQLEEETGWRCVSIEAGLQPDLATPHCPHHVLYLGHGRPPHQARLESYDGHKFSQLLRNSSKAQRI